MEHFDSAGDGGKTTLRSDILVWSCNSTPWLERSCTQIIWHAVPGDNFYVTALVDAIRFRSVSDRVPTARDVLVLSGGNAISDADGWKQASVDAVCSPAPDNAASGWHVTRRGKERMYVPVGLPALPSSCQPWPGLTRRDKANWILNTLSFCLSLSLISTAPESPTVTAGMG